MVMLNNYKWINSNRKRKQEEEDTVTYTYEIRKKKRIYSIISSIQLSDDFTLCYGTVLYALCSHFTPSLSLLVLCWLCDMETVTGFIFYAFLNVCIRRYFRKVWKVLDPRSHTKSFCNVFWCHYYEPATIFHSCMT